MRIMFWLILDDGMDAMLLCTTKLGNHTYEDLNV